MRNGVASSRLTDLGAISAACMVTIGTAKAYHCADICTGTEHGVVGAGFKLITVADDFAGDCRIALMQTLGNICKTKSCILH